MANIFTTGLFKSPKYSVFPHSHSNKLSYGIGDLVPVYYEELGPGDRIVSDIAHLTRFAPLSSPVMDQFELTLDAHFVPFRILDPEGVHNNVPLVGSLPEYKKFFNYYDNVDGSYSIPKVNVVTFFIQVLERSNDYVASIEQSLYDNLGYPMFDNFRRDVLESVAKYNSIPVPGMFTEKQLEQLIGLWGNDKLGFFLKDYRDSQAMFALPVDAYGLKELAVALDASIQTPDNFSFYGASAVRELDAAMGCALGDFSFLSYVCTFLVGDSAADAYIGSNGVAGVYRVLAPYIPGGWSQSGDESAWTSTNRDAYTIDWERVWSDLGHSYDEVVRSYYDWLVWMCMTQPLDSNSSLSPFTTFGDWVADKYNDDSVKVNLLPYYAYWRIVSDWYLNQLLLPNGKTSQEWFEDVVYPSSVLDYDWNCFKRCWSNDYFTSATASAQAGQAVLIPVSGTMQDLRGSNSLIRFKERLLYAGRKFKDQLFAIFGVHSSDARLDMAEVLSREVMPIQIQTVTQMSTGESPVGSLAGNGTGTGARHLVDYTAEEPGIFMVLVSVRPRASYSQGIRRFLMKSDLTEFLLPDFANVGAQTIKRAELYVDADGSDPELDFGYTRKYAEYMFANSEVHGSLRSSMDYWYAGRRFSSEPSLGMDFMKVDTQRDHLNRIFAFNGADTILSYFYFDEKIVRPLPKYVQYSW